MESQELDPRPLFYKYNAAFLETMDIMLIVMEVFQICFVSVCAKSKILD